ncbi:MAG: helix-turn-helix domain-containing protein [Polyangiaceae bacterium]|nr:helix-turn-helix domain-containing protein [Polyangiaceae bacterium]
MDRLTIEGKEYVVLPKAEYERLVGHVESTSDALEFVLDELGRDLRAAREHAGLTQAQLAKKMRKAQATVSGSENGKIRVSESYVKKVLKICGLPEDWKAA